MVNFLYPSGDHTAVYWNEKDDVETSKTNSDQPAEELGGSENTLTTGSIGRELEQLPSDPLELALYWESMVNMILTEMEMLLQRKLNVEIEKRNELAKDYFDFKKKSKEEFDRLEVEIANLAKKYDNALSQLSEVKERIQSLQKTRTVFENARNKQFERWLVSIDSQNKLKEKQITKVVDGAYYGGAWATIGLLVLASPFTAGTSLAVGASLVVGEAGCYIISLFQLQKRVFSPTTQGFNNFVNNAVSFYSFCIEKNPNMTADEIIRNLESKYDLLTSKKMEIKHIKQTIFNGVVARE